MMDACDGPSFNALFGPPPVCSRSHGLEVDKFLALLGDHQDMGAWHNSPSQTDAWVGDTLVAVNNGGEEHTFTRVADFGGGFVPELNALVGTPVPAPECADPSQIDDFVDPGGSDTETLDTTGEIKFQCCIHPWMRTTVLVKSH
jgi:plastocyanin